jgi:hypothetical protein
MREPGGRASPEGEEGPGSVGRRRRARAPQGLASAAAPHQARMASHVWCGAAPKACSLGGRVCSDGIACALMGLRALRWKRVCSDGAWGWRGVAMACAPKACSPKACAPVSCAPKACACACVRARAPQACSPKACAPMACAPKACACACACACVCVRVRVRACVRRRRVAAACAWVHGCMGAHGVLGRRPRGVWGLPVGSIA